MSRILKFEAENIKRIEVLEIIPQGDVVEIAGRNRQGKSSALQCISMAIEGAKSIHKVPIREGAEEGVITLTLGTKGKGGEPDKVDMVVKREFSRREPTKSDAKLYATKLTLTLADGQQPRKAQDILNGLYNSVCTNPLEFTQLQPKEQFDMLRAMVPGYDFEKHDNQQRADFNRRTDVNRDAERAKAAAAIIEVPSGTPDEIVDEKAITDAMANAGTVNGDIERRKAAREKAAEKIDALNGRAVELKARLEAMPGMLNDALAELKAEYDRKVAAVHAQFDETKTSNEAALADVEKEAADLQKRLDEAPALPDPVDTAELQQQLAAAQATNAAVRKKQEKARLAAEALVLEQESADLTARMAAREEAKRAAIMAAKLPVEGLSFGDGEILLNGLPFDQASFREQLVASCAIAMANKPEIRIMHITEGNALDDDGWEVLRTIAAEHDFQVWVESVRPQTDTAVVLENGKVKA